jgi:hypothetical protein
MQRHQSTKVLARASFSLLSIKHQAKHFVSKGLCILLQLKVMTHRLVFSMMSIEKTHKSFKRIMYELMSGENGR